MKDVFGNYIKRGDTIAYAITYGTGALLKVGRVEHVMNNYVTVLEQETLKYKDVSETDRRCVICN